ATGSALGDAYEYAMPASASAVELTYTKDGKDMRGTLNIEELEKVVDKYGDLYGAVAALKDMNAGAEGTKYMNGDDNYVEFKKSDADTAEIKVVDGNVVNEYTIDFTAQTQPQLLQLLAGEGSQVITFTLTDGADKYDVTVCSDSTVPVRVVKNGADEGYDVSFESGDGTFTVTAAAASGNTLVIEKNAEKVLLTASKSLADALDFKVGYFADGETVKPTPEPIPTPVSTPTPMPTPEPTPFEAAATIASAPAEPMSVRDEVTVEVSVDNGTIDNVVWTSSDSDTVKVEKSSDTTAVITALKPGAATVTATVTAMDGDNTCECEATAEINVKYEPTALIKGAPAKMDLSSTKALTVSVDFGSIEKDTIEWSVQGNAVTKTDDPTDKSKVTINAVEAGKATVTVKFNAKDGAQVVEGVTSSVEIEVFDTVEDVKLSTADGDRYNPDTKEIVIDDDENAPDGSATILDLPQPVKSNETVEITVTGTYTGSRGFRIWIGNGGNNYCDPEKFVADFANGEFSRTFKLINTNNEQADKITFKAMTYNGTVNGLTVKSLSVDYFERTPAMEVDLNDPNSFIDDIYGSPVAAYDEETESLDVDFNGESVIVFMNPAEKSVDRYNFVTIEYSSDKDVNVYCLRSRNDSDAAEKEALSATGNTSKVVTMRAADAIYGLKLFSTNGAKMSIKSIMFSNKHPEPGYIDMSVIEKSNADLTGAYDAEKDIVTINDTIGGQRYLLKLPENVAAGDTVKVTINGSFTGDSGNGFRLFLGTNAGGGWNM
ncbi:MAG: Ig-like domain-containing protein, partial [Lachnospiraceae bacterium]|nr:Ig-like domain-containing protein [Lachnospiraceae bacterium]